MSKKVLVIYKKSAYQLAKEQRNKKLLDLIERGDESVSSYKEVHETHQTTLSSIKTTLESFNFDQIDFRYRANADKVNDYDLVITVGGDGTFLWASKFVGCNVPMLGVNSAPGSSVGFYTCANASNFKEVFMSWKGYGSLASSSLSQKRVSRLKLEVNGEVMQDRILNDVFFAAAHPAAMSRYILTVPGDNGETLQEEQRSSGMWISTPCGSTGANLSAGGWPIPIDDVRGQYVVREPMKNFLWGTEHKLIHGFFKKDQAVEITCKTRKALLACDGTTITFPVTTGDRIKVSHSTECLNILGK